MPEHATIALSAGPQTIAVVITGPVGVGKSTTAVALADLLEEGDVPNAMIDMDYLRWVSHRPADDPFHSRLAFRNLKAVAANDREIGVRVLVLADVVESQADRHRYEEAIPGARITIVRLRVPMARMESQLRGRDSGDALAWSLNRAPELEHIMDAAGIGSGEGDLLVDVDGAAPDAVAREIATRLGLVS
ncbi:MAG: hypothetical protein QM753_17180 [Thermomicrobiales bacterium]